MYKPSCSAPKLENHSCIVVALYDCHINTGNGKICNCIQAHCLFHLVCHIFFTNMNQNTTHTHTHRQAGTGTNMTTIMLTTRIKRTKGQAKENTKVIPKKKRANQKNTRYWEHRRSRERAQRVREQNSLKYKLN